MQLEIGSVEEVALSGSDSWDNKKIKSDEYLRKYNISWVKTGNIHALSEMKNRGALGAKEQALLICDVYPELDKRSPNVRVYDECIFVSRQYMHRFLKKKIMTIV